MFSQMRAATHLPTGTHNQRCHTYIQPEIRLTVITKEGCMQKRKRKENYVEMVNTKINGNDV